MFGCGFVLARAARRPAVPIVFAAVICVGLGVGFFRAAPASASDPTTVVFSPVADAYVSRAYRHRNYGARRTLRIRDSRPVMRAYLRFSVRLPAGTEIDRATLAVYSRTTSARGFDVRAVGSNRWRERRITFANAPSISSAVASSGPIERGHWARVDVTPLVSTDGAVTVALTTRATRTLVLGSRESSRGSRSTAGTGGNPRRPLGSRSPVATPPPCRRRGMPRGTTPMLPDTTSTSTTRESQRRPTRRFRSLACCAGRSTPSESTPTTQRGTHRRERA
jgi:hypothetical protein